MSDDPTPRNVIAAIFETGRLDEQDENPDWHAFSVVFEFEFSDDGDVRSTYGYAYAADGRWHAISVGNPDVRAAVDGYLADAAGGAPARPLAMLLQFDRRSGRYEVAFEYEDAARWSVTPDNHVLIRESLRPDL